MRRHARHSRQPADDSLNVYLREIAAYPLLGREQEAELARRGRGGDPAAIQQLICSNLRFVVSVAKRYRHQGVPLVDLIDEGNVGLIRAAQKFDERREIKFISYAVWWIRQAIVQALAEQSRMIRLPLSRVGQIARVGKRTNALLQELGREPTRREISADLEISERDLASTMECAPTCLSLDAPLAWSDDAYLIDHVPDAASAAPDDALSVSGLETAVQTALTQLKGREGIVLRLYFGLGDNEPETLEEIGLRFGVTRERVRQIKERALLRLRRSDAHVLSSLVE